MDNNEERLHVELQETFRVHTEFANFFNSQGIKPSRHLVEIAASGGSYSDGFIDRLIEVEGYLIDRFFGLTYEIVSTKMLRRDRSTEALVEALACGEKYFSQLKVISEQIDWCGFLKLVLERDAPLFNYENYLFGCIGIKRDRSGVSLPQKNAIAVQSAAQVLWYLEKSKIPTIEAMENRLLDCANPFFDLFALGRFNSDRTIKKWVSAVFPVPKKERKAKRLLEDKIFDNLVPIPNVISENGINFQKLIFAIVCVTRILQSLEWQFDQILESKFIRLLTGPISLCSHMFVNNWVAEAFRGNDSIFDP